MFSYCTYCQVSVLNIDFAHLSTKVLTTSQRDWLRNLISSLRAEPAPLVVSFARPSVSFSLQITSRSFRYASLYLWNQLPSSFRQPHCVQCSPSSWFTSSQSLSSLTPSLCQPLTPDLNLICWFCSTSTFLHGLFIPSRYLDLRVTGTGHWARTFVYLSFVFYFKILVTCARLKLTTLSFSVHFELPMSYSYRICYRFWKKTFDYRIMRVIKPATSHTAYRWLIYGTWP